ncbi:hypothetical protein FB639_005517 [Coemansia asiatica]|nr:hypothetical protein FB639_005517 [Coemansia asiatica]
MSHRDKALAGGRQDVQSDGSVQSEENSHSQDPVNYKYTNSKSEPDSVAGVHLRPVEPVEPAEPAESSPALWRIALYENRTLASAVTAAVTGMLAGYPFDSLKTRMQTHDYPSLLACARRSIAEEGILGLYRGLLPPLITASAAKSMSFSVFERTKRWLQRHDPYRHSVNPLGLPDFQRRNVGSVAVTAGVSGSVSGAVIAALCCPLELIKVQMQLANLLSKDVGAADAQKRAAGNAGSWQQHRQAPSWAGSNLSVCREIVRHKGVLGLYYGIGLHVGK